MRVGLLSDIHANLAALEAALAALDGGGRPDALWVTGDTVGYGPDPSDVLALLRERRAVLVQGNHDRGVATGEGLEWFHDRAATAARLHAAWLSAEERDGLAALPLTLRVDGFTLCHGSLRDPLWEYVTVASIAASSIALADTPHTCNGHTHIPALFIEERATVRSVRPTSGRPIALAGRTMLNAGSVGQPRDGDPRAAYAVLDTVASTVTFERTPYDVSATQQRIRARGLPEMFAERLSLGV